MTKKQREYDMEYKIQAVKLAKELGNWASLKTPCMHGRKRQGKVGWMLAPACTHHRRQ
jgi:hypothetical protein